MDVALLVITDGRKQFLEATIASANEKLIHDFVVKVIVNDSQDDIYSKYLDDTYKDFIILHNRPKAGFSGAINTGWQFLQDKVKYIFHLEEDFLFEQNIYVNEMIDLLHQSNAYQMMLKRDAVMANPVEAEYGGYIEANPNLYDQHNGFILHDNFFSTNPSVYSIDICKYGWPDGKGEIEFFDQIKNDDSNAKCGIVGNKFDEPRVRHIGHFRAGDWRI